MDITRNHENPDEIQEKPVPEVAAEDDPTIPEEEKAKAKAKKKSKLEKAKPEKAHASK